MLRAPQTDAHQTIPRPAQPVPLQHAIQLCRRHRRWIALSLIISVVGSLLAFNQFFIMTDGGPGTSTVTVVMSIFDTAFAQMNVGLASAMSVVLVIVVGLITFVQFRILREDGD